jgi:LacI family transcriptional regulator
MGGIKEIAKQAGVSIGTVDRVLHNRGRCADATREKVLFIAQQLNYIPDITARRLKLNAPCRIAVLHPRPSQDQGFWRFADDGMMRACKEFAPFGVEIELVDFDKFSSQSFNRAADTIRSGNFSGLLVAAVLPELTCALLASLPHIPSVGFDTPFDHSMLLQQIYQDGYTAGATVATMFMWLHTQEMSLGVITYRSDNSNIDLRRKGFVDELMRYGYENVDSYVIPDELSYDQLVDFITSNEIRLDKYKGLFIAKTGVAKYARLLNKNKKETFIAGFDLVKDNIEELMSGRIDALISQDSTYQMYDGIKTLVNKLLYQKPPAHPVIKTPCDIITRRNLDAYLSYNL